MKKDRDLHTTRRLFSVNVDLEALGGDLNRNKVVSPEWFNIIEAFIKTFETERELYQLLCISRMHTENPEDHQLFSQAVFKVTDEDHLIQVTQRQFIDRDEYYSKLINSRYDSVENKVRLVFYHGDMKFSLEHLKMAGFTAMQVEYFGEPSDHSVEEIFSDFRSVNVLEELHETIEEAFYRRHLQYID